MLVTWLRLYIRTLLKNDAACHHLCLHDAGAGTVHMGDTDNIGLSLAGPVSAGPVSAGPVSAGVLGGPAGGPIRQKYEIAVSYCCRTDPTDNDYWVLQSIPPLQK